MIDLNSKNTDELNHIIYYEWYMDIRAGGPTGYLANLLDGLNRIENNENPLIFFDTTEKQPPKEPAEIRGPVKYIRKFFYMNEQRRKYYINHISRYQRRVHEEYIRFLSNIDEIAASPELFQKINLRQTKTIHVHTVGDAIKVKNSLAKAHAKNIKVMLTCHTPEAPSDEYYKGYLEQGHSMKRAEEIRSLWRNVERRAFECSDILVFPCKEAMEPLQASMDGFERLVRDKDIRYIHSGAKKLVSTLTREEAKKKYGVEGKFVVGYVGRHNEIKGYDVLQEAAKKVFGRQEDICFLIGGKQGGMFKPLKDNRWIEAGWVNPVDLFMALDVFVLPNRMTYFDLVLLEAMSMGIIVITSETGGNKAVQETTDALLFYNNTADGLADEILKVYHFSDDSRQAVQKNIKAAYEQHYTTEQFAGRYLELINKIYLDYQYI